MNKVILMGRLTKDPELRYTQSAEPLAVTRFTLAVNRPYSKNQEQTADFIGIVSFGKRAETIANYLKKGQMVSVVGRLQIQSYDDPQSGQRKWITDVVLEDFYFAESKASFSAHSGQDTFETATRSPQPPSAPPVQPGDVGGFFPIEDDEDLPF